MGRPPAPTSIPAKRTGETRGNAVSVGFTAYLFLLLRIFHLCTSELQSLGMPLLIYTMALILEDARTVTQEWQTHADAVYPTPANVLKSPVMSISVERGISASHGLRRHD